MRLQTKHSGDTFIHNVKKVLWDTAGAFGDIGVLFPISLALISTNGFNPTALFLMAGLFYIASARFFRITMSVQPMKAMAAIAIASGLGIEVILAAGMIMGIILLALSFSGMSIKLGRVFPLAVIRGIQAGLGLMLVKTSLHMIRADMVTATIAGAILVAGTIGLKHVPPLIPILALAGIMAVGEGLGPAGAIRLPVPALPPIDVLWPAFAMLVLPQIALTFGNAIVATYATAKTLYGERARRVTFVSIPASMGVANILAGIMGGAPMCHGSGGITAHRKFGASSERSGYVIGGTLIALALLFGTSSVAIIGAFPAGILGIMLCFVGFQHAWFIRDILNDRVALITAGTTAVFGMISGNLTVGFLVGIALHHTIAGLRRVAGQTEKH